MVRFVVTFEELEVLAGMLVVGLVLLVVLTLLAIVLVALVVDIVLGKVIAVIGIKIFFNEPTEGLGLEMEPFRVRFAAVVGLAVEFRLEVVVDLIVCSEGQAKADVTRLVIP